MFRGAVLENDWDKNNPEIGMIEWAGSDEDVNDIEDMLSSFSRRRSGVSGMFIRPGPQDIVIECLDSSKALPNLFHAQRHGWYPLEKGMILVWREDIRQLYVTIDSREKIRDWLPQRVTSYYSVEDMKWIRLNNAADWFMPAA